MDHTNRSRPERARHATALGVFTLAAGVVSAADLPLGGTWHLGYNLIVLTLSIVVWVLVYTADRLGGL